MSDTWTLHFDGACANNGFDNAYGAWGWTLEDGVFPGYEGSGNCTNSLQTNNLAEMEGMKQGLLFCLSLGLKSCNLVVKGDSQLAIGLGGNTMKTKKPHLMTLKKEVRRCVRLLEAKGVTVRFKWIAREKNEKADNLAGMVLVPF